MNKSSKKYLDELTASSFTKDTKPEYGVARIEIHANLQPSFRVLVENEKRGEEIAQFLEMHLLKGMCLALRGLEYESRWLQFMRDQSRLLVTSDYTEPSVRNETIDQMMERLRGNEPDPAPYKPSTETKRGWWRVAGIRHSTLVLANSESEALEKSLVNDWESPSAHFMFNENELPEVIDL